MDELDADRPVVVIGAGIIGTSAAFHLSAAGHRNVTVLDRGGIGEGTTARATGGIRQLFTSPLNATLVHRSIAAFTTLAETTGEPFQFRQHGYLFLLTRPEQQQAFAAAVAMQNDLGIPSRMVDADEIARLHPDARTDDLVGGVYCGTDGSASPTDATNAYAKAARRAGVRFRTRCAVLDILTGPDGAVRGVRTTDGDIDAVQVLLAAGPHSRELGTRVGVDLQVSPHRRQAFVIEPLPWLSPQMPFTVDISTGAYIHVEAAGAVIGGNDRDAPEGTDMSVDWARLPDLLAALVARWPRMLDAELRRGWAGLREMTPDDHALVGPARQVPGLWVATGFSGHGFMQAPAIGAAMAQLMTTGRSDVDITPLRPERFAEGAAITESLVF